MFKIVSKLSKIVAVVVAVFLTLLFLNFTLNFSTKSFASGEYTINTAQDLYDLANSVNNGNNFYLTEVNLMQDIDLNFAEWQAIGITKAKCFAGSFNGNGHKISGLLLESGGNTGLFGALCGKVENLVLETKIVLRDFEETAKIGGIAGNLISKLIEGTNVDGSIANCVVYVEIVVEAENSNTTQVGGVVGTYSSNTKLTDCVTYVQNEYNFTQGDMSFGLLAGKSDISATDCVAYGNENFITIENENINSGKLDFGESWAFCESCEQMYLKIDTLHLHQNDTKIITPELAKTIYEYTQKPLELSLKPITKLNENDNISYKIELISQNLGENIAKISLLGADKDKYILSTDTVKFTVIAKKVYIDIKANSSVYGEPLNDIEYTQSIDENLQIEFGLFQQNEQVDAYNVGEYDIKVTTCNENYKLVIAEAKYTILSREIEPKTSDFTCYYSTIFDFASIELENVLDCDKSAVYCINNDTIPQDIGTYALKIAISGDRSNNYLLAKNEINLTILPKNIAVIWQDSTFTFNNEFQYPLATITENEMVENIEFSYSQYGKFAGKNTVVVKSENKNYTITNNEKTYTILPLQVEVSWTNTVHIFDAQPFYPQFEVKLDFEYQINIITSSSQSEAGDYTATLNALDTNILLNNNTTQFTITPFKIDIVWTNVEFTFDNLPHAPEFDFKPLPFEYDLNLTKPAPQINAGEYSGTVILNDKNFTIFNAKTQFFIKKYNFSLIWSGNSFIFDSTMQCPTVQNDLPFEYNLSINYTSAQSEVGKYTIEASTRDDNINLLNKIAEYEILPYVCELRWSNISDTFNNTGFNPNCSFELPFVYDLKINLSAPQVNAGQYTCTATTVDKNIKLLNASTLFTIQPKMVRIVWANAYVCYTGYLQAPTCAYNILDYDFPIEITGAQENVGVYTVTAATTDTNIKIDNNMTKFEIYNLVCEVLWGENEFVYNGSEFCPTPTLNLANNINKEKITLKTRGASSSIGSHTAVAYTDNKNVKLYNIACSYKILENSAYFVSQEVELDVHVSGEFVGDVDIDLTTIDEKNSVPRNWEILCAIKLENRLKNTENAQKLLQNTQKTLIFEDFSVVLADLSDENNKSIEYNFKINYSMIVGVNNLKVYLITDNDFSQIDYNISNKNLSFTTNDLGVLCIVNEKPDTFVSDLIRSIVGTVMVVCAGIFITIKHLQEKQQVVFKKVEPQTAKNENEKTKFKKNKKNNK